MENGSAPAYWRQAQKMNMISITTTASPIKKMIPMVLPRNFSIDLSSMRQSRQAPLLRKPRESRKRKSALAYR